MLVFFFPIPPKSPENLSLEEFLISRMRNSCQNIHKNRAGQRVTLYYRWWQWVVYCSVQNDAPGWTIMCLEMDCYYQLSDPSKLSPAQPGGGKRISAQPGNK